MKGKKVKEITKLYVGMEGIIHGYRWVIVEEVYNDGDSGFAIDQDGQDYEVTLGSFDHIYG